MLHFRTWFFKDVPLRGDDDGISGDNQRRLAERRIVDFRAINGDGLLCSRP